MQRDHASLSQKNRDLPFSLGSWDFGPGNREGSGEKRVFVCLCRRVMSGGGRERLGGWKGLGCGEGERVGLRLGRPRGLGGGGLGQDAEQLSYSRKTSLVTAGGCCAGIPSPAWDARSWGKKKNPAFSHPGVRAISGTPETARSLQTTTPRHRGVNTHLFLIFRACVCSFITSSSSSTSSLCKRQ